MRVDVLVAGGGVAGCATALALARRGRRVVVVERLPEAALRVGEHLAPAGRAALDRLGLGAAFAADGHLPCPAVRAAWGQADLGERDYLFDAFGQGWNLDRRRFDRMLVGAVRHAGAALWRPARIRSLHGAPREWRLEIERAGQRRRVAATMLVDASGRAAALAKRFGSRCQRVDRLIARVRWYRAPAGSALADPGLLVEAVADGWWYLAALPGRRLVAALLRDRDGPSRDGWAVALEAAPHAQARLVGHGYEQIGETICPAHSGLTEPVAGPGWLAVGDAASAFDPLSSRGIACALGAGTRAALALDRALAGGPDALEEYAADVGAEWQAYLGERARTYRQEGRWPDAPFWRGRRQDARPATPRITLDPTTVLRRAEGDGRELAAVPTSLARSDLEHLCRVCARPKPAHQAARDFQRGAGRPVGDARIIRALQALVSHGFLVGAGGRFDARSSIST